MMNEKIILLVEDNPDDVELTRRAFRKSNILNRLVVVSNGVEALDFLFATGTYVGRAPEDNPCLVLLDLKLPKISGLEVLQRMREDPRTKLLPVVVLTSSVEEQDIVRSYSLGCNSYIRKPVDFTQFATAVQQLSVYWLLINEPPRMGP